MSHVVSAATQAIVLCDALKPGRPITYSNNEFERLTGFARGQVQAHSPVSLLRPEGDAYEWDHINTVMEGTLPWRKALPVARKDGTVFWAELHVYPLSESGRVTHWVFVLSDVTENLGLHQALHDSEAQLRLLTENIRDLVIVHDESGRCSYVSPSLHAMLGYMPDRLSEKTFTELMHPKDQKRAGQVFAAHFQGHARSHLIHRLRRQDGTYIWAETVSKTRHKSASGPSCIISVTRDISKRRRAQDDLAAIHNLLGSVYEAVPTGLCLLDEAGMIVQNNRAFSRTFGFQDNTAEGCSADALMPSEALRKACENPATPVECECTDIQGARFPAEITAAGMKPTSIANYLVLVADLRERKKIEARLRELNQLEGLGSLAGGIAHEFNNLLSIVLAYSSLLRDAGGDPGRINHYADTLLDAGRRGAALVRQLQLFANTHVAELVPANIHELLEKAITQHGGGLPSGNIRLEKIFSASDATLTVDASQFTQAIGKLIDNAREAMPAGGTLVIRTSETRQAVFTGAGTGEQKDFLRISVEDTGIGMEASTRARLFEPFFNQGGKADSGAGMGLALVHGIMRAHGGTIEVDSAPGKGTRFHLLFPRSTPSTAPANRSTDSMPPAPAASRRTILLAEDEQDIGLLWQEVFPDAGWRVIWARDGGEALRLFRSHRDEIALVFTDIIMPHVDGWQLVEAVRKEAPDMPLLIASGAFHRNDRNRPIPEPVLFLPKPYVPSKVLKLIESLVRKRPVGPPRQT